MHDHLPHPPPPAAPSGPPGAPAHPAPPARLPRQHSSTRFAVPVDAALREAGWQPGRWDIRQAEEWADALRAHTSPAGHRHAVFPAAVEAWAEFGALHITASAPGRQIAPAAIRIDPLHGLHLARTLGDLGRALETEVAPLGAEGDEQAVLAIDTEGRVFSIDHTGDWFLGQDIDEALTTLVTGAQPARLSSPPA
ncbi:SUKH-3 domain-containing protein [Streptomyces bacillaris]|uniref:SUKH-3 domain-containing protein n=1 Tax=Streptomyces cavourensis TaxID=67258 RepID=A0ABY5FFC2_9ACTN|nr:MULTISPECIES: SUKH-3 domain-containing protein [Streptomyces]MCR8945821.1 SUKH-3 domain-containing protein [Streptomyces sp. OUCMDZ-4982]UTR82417.1 SUKH-3 domain-containing protein [Streptomyces cavourensis]WAE66573.1 SUKH-3 domain-containing protein [Streptomyces cavourensis]